MKAFAIAALALLVTSGLASAQTPGRAYRADQSPQITTLNANAAIHSPHQRGYVGSNGYMWHPGDNSMDEWLKYNRQGF